MSRQPSQGRKGVAGGDGAEQEQGDLRDSAPCNRTTRASGTVNTPETAVKTAMTTAGRAALLPALAGGAGSGKTTVACALAARLGAGVVHLDGCHHTTACTPSTTRSSDSANHWATPACRRPAPPDRAQRDQSAAPAVATVGRVSVAAERGGAAARPLELRGFP